MKKKLLILAVAGLALASCSNDETVAVNQSGPKAISFRPLINNATRATSLETTDFSGGSTGFYVTATHATGHTTYFADQMFKWNSSTSRYEPYTGSDYKTIYWPTYNLDFHAYAYNGAADQVSVSNANIASENGCPQYTVTPNTAAADQTDFIYATLTNQTPNTGDMALAFGHKESQISVKLKNTDTGLSFTVSEVALCKIVSSGVFKNNNASPSTATTMSWTPGNSTTEYSQTGLSLNPTTEITAGTSWILIPHTLTKPTTDGQYIGSTTGDGYNGAYIRVKMKVQSATDANVYYAGDADNYVSAIWPISTNASAATWVAGTHYTYTIDLAGGGYYETNQATPLGSTLDRVLNLSPITFATVTVSSWSNGGNTDVGM